jgi:hypothetical protein
VNGGGRRSAGGVCLVVVSTVILCLQFRLIDAGRGGFKGLPLSEFLPSAVEALRQAEGRSSEPAVRVANLRGAFRLAKQVGDSYAERWVEEDGSILKTPQEKKKAYQGPK